MTAVLAADNLVKRFPGVVALRGVSFALHAGEVHALCGENGAGKSTLIKTLSGIHPHGSYEGRVLRDGRELTLHGVKDAERHGIAVIYQELALVPQLSVAENIFLGREATRGGLLDHLSMQTRTRALLARFGIDVDPAAPVGTLGVGLQQLVEIVRALAKDSRVLILDEPTAALSTPEVEALLRIVRDLKNAGVACVYISHKLDEVLAIADRITVLRDGQSVATLDARRTGAAEIIRHMVGREIEAMYPRRARAAADAVNCSTDAAAPLLRVHELDVDDDAGRPRLRGVGFDVRPGEVLGIGGLMGAGRTELLMHLMGAWGRRVGGSVELGDRPLQRTTPDRAIAAGLVLVSEDRKRYGLVLEQSVGFNLSLSGLAALTRAGLLDHAAEHRRNRGMFEALRVRAPSLDAPVGKLSGGNQQKVVLGRALATTPRVVLLDEPTRGIDVGAKLEVYELINRLTDEGRAVVLVSSELPELMGMSDRILMLDNGRPGGTFARADATQERLMAAALGQPEASPA